MDLFICSDPAWGSFSQIVTAGAAVVAASTGVYGVRNAVRTYKISVADQERQAENERRDQARFVHPVLLEVDKSKLVEGPDGSDEFHEVDSLRVKVRITNGSDEVISDVHLGITSYDDADADALAEAATGDHLEFLTPNKEWDSIFEFPFDYEIQKPEMLKATVLFTDGRNNIWARTTGEPIEDFTRSH